MARKSTTGKAAGKSSGSAKTAAATSVLPKTSADLNSEEKPPGDAMPADAPPPTETSDDKRERKTITFGSRVYAAENAELGGHTLDILPDMPDIRDRPYSPRLTAMKAGLYPKIAFKVRNQGKDGSCTGFSLAHVIDVLRHSGKITARPQRVSARMLYEMAKRNDEWDGTAYEGSSLRGAIKGFFRNGVCTEDTAPNITDGTDWSLTYEMAKEARQTRLGAYFRLQPDLTDYHAALNEVGVIYVSAQIHSNWATPDAEGRIKPGGDPKGGHAFAIVGYDEESFWVLNSWGNEWGMSGTARWDYADWANTVMDAWVLQLGVSAPKAFGAIPRVTPASASGGWSFADPSRANIVGHFINIDDGRLVTAGKYESPVGKEMQETVDRLLNREANSGRGFDHLVIYAHGGINDLTDEARRIATWQRNTVFTGNDIYNFHLMWGSGFIDELFGRMSKSPAVAGPGSWSANWLFEAGPGREAGAYAWRNMKQDARMAFEEAAREDGYDGGFVGLKPLLQGIDKGAMDPATGKLRRPKLHLVGHSAGSIVLGYLLSALKRFELENVELGSVHLMAPACTVPFFIKHYKPYLDGKGALKVQDKVYLYNLEEITEKGDSVQSSVPLTPRYDGSLLYLVSRAFEDQPDKQPASKFERIPLAGLKADLGGMPESKLLQFDYSPGGKTASASHGGFDNDAATLTTIMSRILGGAALRKPPTAEELVGY